jgi:hypothetical protein
LLLLSEEILMRLEGLYPNFGRSSPEMQVNMLATYRLKRMEDLAKTPTSKKRSPASQTTPVLTEEEKVIMKLLGLKQKDITALRSSTDEVDTEDGADLFKDAGYEEDEDE